MTAQENLSIVSIGGEYSSSCGYCGSETGTSVAFGMAAEKMSVQVYQDLLDRGWRRSGTWLYLPTYDKTCCICYTHRLDVHKFSPNKVQAKAVRRFEAFLSGEKQGGSQDTSASKTCKRPLSEACTARKGAKRQDKQPDSFNSLAEALRKAANGLRVRGLLPNNLAIPAPKVHQPKNSSVAAMGVQCTSAYAFVLAASIRKGTADSEKHSEHGPEDIAAVLISEMELGDGVTASALNGHLNFHSKPKAGASAGLGAQTAGQRCVSETQRRVMTHGAEPLGPHQKSVSPSQAPTQSQYLKAGTQDDASSFEKAAQPDPGGITNKDRKKLEIVMRQSSSDLIELEFPLYRKYQIRQHKDPPYKVTRSQFRRFLIDSPLVPVPPLQGKTPACGFGSFHQQYWIDGVLVAVGVVDILPSCLSSKYFFWDPDHAHLSLGRISALKEIEWVAEASQDCPSLHYYYMGFYIHTCPKMVYKIDFAPADLLCPKRLLWIPFERVKGYLDQEDGKVLSDAPDALKGLGREYIPAHKQLVQQGDPKVTAAEGIMSLKIVSGNLEGMTPTSLSELLRTRAISQIFVDRMCPLLEQLRARIGPLSKNIAVSI